MSTSLTNEYPGSGGTTTSSRNGVTRIPQAIISCSRNWIASNGSVSFFEERDPERNGQLMLGGLITLPLVETIMSRLDDLILKVSDLHHRVAFVGGSPMEGDPPV